MDQDIIDRYIYIYLASTIEINDQWREIWHQALKYASKNVKENFVIWNRAELYTNLTAQQPNEAYVLDGQSKVSRDAYMRYQGAA